MIKMIKNLVLVMFVIPLTAIAAESYQEGKHYFKLDDPVPTQARDKIEIAEAFWYGCRHCFTLEPTIEAWKKTLPEYASFRKVPAQFSKVWKNHGQFYFTLDSLDVPETIHDDVFNAIHKQKLQLSNRDQMVDFVRKYGVTSVEFDRAFKSFGVRNQMRQADKVVKGAKIAGVPALIVNGKYRISARSAGSNADMLKVAEYLMEQERKLLNDS